MHNAGLFASKIVAECYSDVVHIAMEGLKELGVAVLLSSRVDLRSAEDHDGKRTLRTVDGRRVGAELVVRLHSFPFLSFN